MMMKYLTVLFLLFVVMPAQAKWIKLDMTAKQGETHHFEPETMQKNDQFRKIWVLSSYDEKQKGGHHAVKTLYEFDCAHHKARSLTMLLCPDKEATGRVIGAHHEESRDWFGFSANSMFRHIAETICFD
ncbi:surface-adhesin E family protein [Nitrosomonas sp.]|uniref:surface-adhesin E family protein n=1 Tax=Nitrosomonas sp. TaxID=42353 RepID=UPI0025F09A57|nr:surface-adhesin E family protein [Nitrosomonas sp.]